MRTLKLAPLAVLLMVPTLPASAQNFTCTPAVSAEICKQAGKAFGVGFVEHGLPQADIVIADPSSFERERDSLLRKMEVTRHNPKLVSTYSEDIMIEREFGSGLISSCPTRIVISTAAFRPVEITKEGKLSSREGFDFSAASLVNVYVWGFNDGCFAGMTAQMDDALK